MFSIPKYFHGHRQAATLYWHQCIMMFAQKTRLKVEWFSVVDKVLDQYLISVEHMEHMLPY